MDVGEFVTMLHCVYNALLEVDFRHVESIEIDAFNQLCSFALHGLITGSPIQTAILIFGTQAAEGILEDINRLYRAHNAARDRENWLSKPQKIFCVTPNRDRPAGYAMPRQKLRDVC